MLKQIKQFFCDHKYRVHPFVPYDKGIGDTIRHRSLHKCKKCGKEKFYYMIKHGYRTLKVKIVLDTFGYSLLNTGELTKCFLNEGTIFNVEDDIKIFEGELYYIQNGSRYPLYIKLDDCEILQEKHESNFKIEDMIEDFKKFDNNDVLEKTFTEGYCYDFACILERNYQGKIYYMKNKNHYIFKCGNNFYDITGRIYVGKNDILIKDN